MIIRCPECSTGFNLPDDRVTPEGTKLKCSRCAHVFRVREQEGGEGTEIFYKDGDNGKTKPSADDGGSPFGGGSSGSPFAGLGPSKSSAFSDVEKEEPQGLAVPTSEAESMEEVKEDPQTKETQPVETMADPGSEPETAPADGPLMGSGSHFGDPEEHVDPSFGTEGPVFDPDAGKVEATSSQPSAPEDDETASAAAALPGQQGGSPAPKPGATAAGPPTGAKRTGPPPTGGEGSGPPTGPPTSISASDGDEDWDDADLDAHRIGGGPGQKIVNFVFLLLLVGVGFLGTVAYLNDGFLDFYAFDEMIEVAFAEGEYEPRAEWRDDGPTVQIVESADPIAVESVHGELVDLGDESVFVVQGVARNQEEIRVLDIDLRATMATLEGRSLREVRRPLSPAVEIGSIRSASSAQEAGALLDQGGVTLEAGEMTTFTVIVDDLPQRVIDGEGYTFRVEVADLDESQ